MRVLRAMWLIHYSVHFLKPQTLVSFNPTGLTIRFFPIMQLGVGAQLLQGMEMLGANRPLGVLLVRSLPTTQLTCRLFLR